MRWPFHFGRSPDAGKARAQESAARRRDWESLPPIQRAVADPELTAPTMDFVESLAGSHDPATSIEPLGHHVSIEAPHGLVSGIVATNSYSPSIEMIGRPRRGRQGLTAQRSIDETQPVLEPGGTAESEDAVEPMAPVRDLPPVEAAAASPKPLTRLAESDRTAVLSLASVQRARSQTAEPAVDRSATQERSPAAERPPEGATRMPSFPVAGQAPVAQRLTLGQSRRLGLGPPLAAGALPALQRSAATPPPELSAALPLARPAASMETTPQPSPEPKSDAPQTAPESVAAASADAAVGSMSSVAAAPSPVSRLPVLPLIEMHAKGSSPTPLPAVQRVAPDEPAVTQRLAATPQARPAMAQPTITVPLVSSRPPLLTGRSTVTGAAEAAPDGEDIASAATVQLMPVSPIALEPIARPSERNQPDLPNYSDSLPTSMAQPARTPISPHAPEPPQLLMRPAVQRAVAAPEQESPAPPVFQPAFFAASPFAGGMQHVQVQRQPEAAEAPMQAPVAAEVPAAAPVAPAGGAAPSHDSEKELDELARKLHDRISDRIRYDLLLDRERAGMLTDLR